MPTTSEYVNILYFASLGEQLGVSEERLALHKTTNIGQLKNQLYARSANWRKLLSDTTLNCAVNHSLCDDHLELQANDEVAFFPAVTGG